jgi:two-component system cell cycle response regulator
MTQVMVSRDARWGRWLLAAATLGLAATLLRNLGVMSPILEPVWDKGYNATEFLAAAACGLRVVRSRGSERAAWAALTVGLFGFAAGDVYYTAALESMASPPFPSLADAGYLSIYPAAYVALVLLLRARAGRVSSQLWLDGIVCALAVAAIGAALVFGVVASTDGPFATVATNLAYPLGDLIMLAFVIAVTTIAGRRAGSGWLLLALAFAIWAVADTIYLYQSAKGTYTDFTVLDTAWPASYVLMAFAAWRPARGIDARRLRRGILALPACLTLVALAMLMRDHYSPLNQVALWLACAAVATAVVRFALTFRENLRMLGASEVEATTDLLTGLGNRRALLYDLDRAVGDARVERPALLALFDLDGFKTYNDSFGHVAGDALLARLGRNLGTAAAGGFASAYRLGGDEFCLLVIEPGPDPAALVARAAAALHEAGESFDIGCSYGAVLLPAESADVSDALRTADQRMYAHKRAGRRGSDEAVHRVLLRVAAEHDGALRNHVDYVAHFAEAVACELGLDDAARIEVTRAAALHDIGKVAIPDAILEASRALDASEWDYMRQHTLIGERIIGAAPELLAVARIVRSTHERYDGAGYPDRLAGNDIPLGARIVAVCDAYDAMVTTRAYRAALPSDKALAELRRCSGTQFDPRIVAAFDAALVRLLREADAVAA